MGLKETDNGQHPLLTTLDPNDPGERFYGYQVTRRMVEPPKITVHPGPDLSGRAPATFMQIREQLSSPQKRTVLPNLRGGVFYVTDHGVFEEGTKDGQRPRRTNKGDTRRRGR